MQGKDAHSLEIISAYLREKMRFVFILIMDHQLRGLLNLGGGLGNSANSTQRHEYLTFLSKM